MLRPIPLTNFAYPVLKEDGLPRRPRGHIAEHERIISNGLLWLKFSHQHLSQPANTRLVNRTRVMSNEAREPPARTAIPDPARTIQRMKSRNR